MIAVRRTSWTAIELLEADFPEPRFAVPNVVAEGLNLLVGAPKLGKSWLALNLGIAVAGGGSALGKVPVEQGGVLYLALEDGPAVSRSAWRWCSVVSLPLAHCTSRRSGRR